MTGYYLGFLFGSLATQALVNQVGHIRVFAALASMASTAILVQVVFISPPVWFLMRLITGFCFAGVYVIAEGWLNALSNNETRGQTLSLYMLISFAGLAGGQWLLKLADPTAVSLFVLSSVFTLNRLDTDFNYPHRSARNSGARGHGYKKIIPPSAFGCGDYFVCHRCAWCDVWYGRGLCGQGWHECQ